MSNQCIGGIIGKSPPPVSQTAASGMWSLSQQAVLKKSNIWAAVLPNAPVIGVATAITYSTATVTFTPPENKYGITGYIATSSPSGITGTVSGENSTSITVSGLAGSTNYTFTVQAVSSVGTGPASIASNQITTAPAVPTVIGQSWGGGFYAGKISTSANGVATHYLIVSPKATGETTREWGGYGTVTNITSKINGPTNSASLAALGYAAAAFCEGLSIGGYTDWYLPASNELEVLYYFLKPAAFNNDTSYGANVNAVSPEPYNTNYSTSSPGQTTAVEFQDGNTNGFVFNYYWSSSEDPTWIGVRAATVIEFGYGSQSYAYKYDVRYVRAVRRIPIV